VLGVYIFASFYGVSIRFYNCTDNVVFFVFHFNNKEKLIIVVHIYITFAFVRKPSMIYIEHIVVVIVIIVALVTNSNFNITCKQKHHNNGNNNIESLLYYNLKVKSRNKKFRQNIFFPTKYKNGHSSIVEQFTHQSN
jgi:hypothetical protein